MDSVRTPTPMEKITFISRCLARIAFGALLTPCLALAQSPGSGTITGRIFNPIRGEYVRDAQINIANTGQAATSADGGLYRLINVPPGPVTVVVNYAGFNSATATVNSVAGQVTTLEFELTSAGGQSADAGTPLKLDKFVVSTEREGNAKAIMSQRTSMNITNSVASDVFGDIPDGNVATFIKNLPGVDIETASTVDRTPRLRGLPADYTQVTIDGINLASADANASTAANGRAFSFEQVSLNSMESIEINKTVSADQEANAPAGTIELKSKHAFDRKGRRITLLAGVSAHSEGFYLGKRTYGPDDSEKRPRILPSGILEYSDVFLNQRLGVVLNLSYANVYSPNSSSTTTYNFTPTAADPRPVVVTAVAVSRAQRANESFSSTLTTDFKATENLVFSFVMLFNYKDNEIKNYGGTFNAGARNTVVGATPVLSLTTSEAGGAGRSVANINNTTSKFSESYSYLPRFVYKRGDLTIEGRFALSIARSDYKPLGKHHKIQAALYDNLTGVNFRAERSSPLSADWQITQISGPDWADLSNYRNPRAVNDTHKSSTDLMTGDVTASYPTNRWIPIVWKTGVKLRRADYTFWNKNASDTWRYNGPGGGPTGSWGAFPSGYATNLGMLGARITSLSGRGLTSPDNIKIGTLFEEHPEYFTNIATPADYYTGLIANDKIYRETVGAAFLMGTATIGKLEVRAGVRWEDTTTLSTEFDPFPASKVVAAGFPVAAGRATTVPGLNYQYFTNPRRKRPGGYDYFFPSASAKYSLTKNLSAHLGYSRTIRRPTFNDVTGVFMIDEDNRTVSAPNTSLKPEL